MQRRGMHAGRGWGGHSVPQQQYYGSDIGYRGGGGGGGEGGAYRRGWQDAATTKHTSEYFGDGSGMAHGGSGGRYYGRVSEGTCSDSRVPAEAVQGGRHQEQYYYYNKSAYRGGGGSGGGSGGNDGEGYHGRGGYVNTSDDREPPGSYYASQNIYGSTFGSSHHDSGSFRSRNSSSLPVQRRYYGGGGGGGEESGVVGWGGKSAVAGHPTDGGGGGGVGSSSIINSSSTINSSSNASARLFHASLRGVTGYPPHDGNRRLFPPDSKWLPPPPPPSDAVKHPAITNSTNAASSYIMTEPHGHRWRGGRGGGGPIRGGGSSSGYRGAQGGRGNGVGGGGGVGVPPSAAAPPTAATGRGGGGGVSAATMYSRGYRGGGPIARGGGGRPGRGYYSNYTYVASREGPSASSSRRDYYHEGAMADVEGLPLPPSTYCRNFAFAGSCRFGIQCRYSHRLRCAGWQLDAHGAAPVTCCAFNAAAAGNPELFTAGKDNILRRWALVSADEEGAAETGGGASGAGEEGQQQHHRGGSGGGATAAGGGGASAAAAAASGSSSSSGGGSGPGRPLWIDFACIAETSLGSGATTMIFVEGVLFVGLENGVIKAFLPDGSVKELRRHTGAVQSVLAVDGALCSGGWDGRVCLWKYENGDFVLTRELLLQGGGITCMRELAVLYDASASLLSNGGSAANAPGGAGAAALTSSDALAQGQQANKRLIWVGGMALNVLNAGDLTVLRNINIDDAKPQGSIPLVLALVAYERNMLVGFSSGVIKAFTAEGEELFRFQGQYLSTMEGLLSPDGPILMYGGADGALHALRLPQFEELGQLTAHEDGDVKVIKYASDDFFFTCGEDSVICVWQWNRDTEK